MRGDSGVAGEGRVVGVPKFHSWGKCTMISNQIGCPMLPLAFVLYCIIDLRGSFKLHVELTLTSLACDSLAGSLKLFMLLCKTKPLNFTL